MGVHAAGAGVFDPPERAAEKEARRERDCRELAGGQIAVEELRRRNGALFVALQGARIDVSRTPSLGEAQLVSRRTARP
jgi:hypothetical protein